MTPRTAPVPGPPAQDITPGLPTVQDALAGTRLLLGLPRFLLRRLDHQQAVRIVQARLARREGTFLANVRRFVFDDPRSPYVPLFRHAGCEFADVERLVQGAGVEGALRTLVQNGICLTLDEYKGRRPVRRGSLAYTLDPRSLRNPHMRSTLPVRSSGSRGHATPFPIDLRFVADCAVNCLLMLSARGPRRWQKADWEVPGGGALFRLLKFSQFGHPPVRWFSQIDPAAAGLPHRYRWSSRVLRWSGRLSGVRLPGVQHVPLDAPLPIARWMTEEVAQGCSPLLFTFPSSAVAVCLAAEKAGLSLAGASFLVSGEPITPARVGVITRTGAELLTRYGTIECGPIGYGCLDPAASDDLHLNHDLHAIVQAERDAPRLGVPADAIFLTTLRPTSPFIFLNVSLGDQAILSRRACGCPLDQMGWHGHIRSIRSFEKLTGAGITLMDTDVVRVLEEILPARFGGGPTDYQLLEEEDADGRPVLRLLIRPELGPLDEDAVREAFLAGISRDGGVKRVMGMALREARIVRVERRAPVSTPSGKLLHLVLRR